MALSISIPRNLSDFPDQALRLGQNGAAAPGNVQAAIAKQIQYRQHQGRTLFHWWGGWDEKGINVQTNGVTVFRFARHNALVGGGRQMRADVQCVAPALNTTTQGIVFDGFLNFTSQNASTATYPIGLNVRVGCQPGAATDGAITGNVEEQTIGFNAIRPVAGCIYEDQINQINISDTVVDTALAPGRDILATQAGAYGTLSVMASVMNLVQQNRRTQISWSCPDDSYLEFSASTQSWRYAFDQTIGDGGIAPANTGPAFTLPNQFCGYGLSTGVRVYVYVYAAMSGATDSGSIGIANKTLDGSSFVSFRALTNPPTIGGTGYAWYPSLGAGIVASTDAYFLSTAVAAFDRVLIGAKSGGATDKVRIKAWTMIVYPVTD